MTDMTDQHIDARTEPMPFRDVMRTTALTCMAAALGILGAHWTGLIPGTEDLVPVAVVLGVWANLLSAGMLVLRRRS